MYVKRATAPHALTRERAATPHQSIGAAQPPHPTIVGRNSTHHTPHRPIMVALVCVVDRGGEGDPTHITTIKQCYAANMNLNFSLIKHAEVI